MIWRILSLICLSMAASWAIDPGATEFRWRGSVGRSAVVALRNIDCVEKEIMPGPSREVEVIARLNGRHDPEAVAIEVVQTGGGIEISAVPASEARDVEVHVTVRIPAGVRLKIARPGAGKR